MNRLSSVLLAAAITASLGLTAVAAPVVGNTGHNQIAQAAPSTAPAPPADFGAPPSGQVPILFNDHHVYSKPDVLKQGRVLAALVRGGTILVPLRSMFEQMGATVNFDPATRTVDVTKPGSDVKVTIGRPEVTINGETRPLDVPPMMYRGTILVPVRVISEGMGAYVQWVPDQHVVVVRYAPPTPPAPAPPPAATPAPTVAPTPTPAPVKAEYNDHFIVGDYIFDPKVYNEFSPGNTGHGGSLNVRAGLEFNLIGLPWMLEGDFRQYQYPHNAGAFAPGTTCAAGAPGTALGDQGCVTVIGGGSQAFVPAFTASDKDVDVRFGLRVLRPRVYVGVGYLWRTDNYGYPNQHGFGYGIEKLPDLDKAFSLYGSAWYYPQISGTCSVISCPAGPYDLQYHMLKYQIGGTLNIGAPAGVFLDFGWLGDRLNNKQNAPANVTHNGPYLGLGIHF